MKFKVKKSINGSAMIFDVEEYEDPNYIEKEIGVVVEYVISKKKPSLYTDLKAVHGLVWENELQNILENETKSRFPEYERTVTKFTLV